MSYLKLDDAFALKFESAILNKITHLLFNSWMTHMNKKILYCIMLMIGITASIDQTLAKQPKNNKSSNKQTPPPTQPPVQKPVHIDTTLALHIFYPGDIKNKFSDLAGLEEEKNCLRQIISYMKDPSVYDAIGARVNKGILFYGETGNGKTMLVRAFAGEINCTFINMNGSSFIELYVGVGPSRVRELFSIARQLAPCIIFIDEIDALLTARTNDKEYSNTTNAFLTEMDGLYNEGAMVIVVGATNRLNALDDAAIRPGRFDRKIYISKPTFEARIELLNKYLQRIKHAFDLDVDYIARMTTGFSCAELTNLLNESALIAIYANSTYVDIIHVKQAFDRIKNRKA